MRKSSLEEILFLDSDAGFRAAALEVFRFQAQACGPYAEYVGLCGIDPQQVREVEEIPFLPVSLFKDHRVYCGAEPPGIVFTSSTTGGGKPSRHLMESVEKYERTFLRAFELAYGDPAGYSFYCLLPSYLERAGSSLVCMADRLIREGGGGFYLDDYRKLLDDMAADGRPKILLGVSYALWELAERFAPDLGGVIVMETGGMKGRREELPREEFHALLTRAFKVGKIHSEYGMAELSSQAYSKGEGVFAPPPWMRVLVRDLNDPFDVSPVGTGGVDLIDLANLHSCAFIQTDDLGTVFPNGDFMIRGRVDHSEVRGCNLLVERN